MAKWEVERLKGLIIQVAPSCEKQTQAAAPSCFQFSGNGGVSFWSFKSNGVCRKKN